MVPVQEETLPAVGLRPITLYRIFDEQDRLLYVGISLSVWQRISTHRQTKVWWRWARRVELEHFRSKREVEQAEVTAIKLERPLYNSTHNDSRKPVPKVEPLEWVISDVRPKSPEIYHIEMSMYGVDIETDGRAESPGEAIEKAIKDSRDIVEQLHPEAVEEWRRRNSS